jgi:hypothetical protein
MSDFKHYTRNPSQVLARLYEVGDEDGFIVDRNNGKQDVVEQDDKSYQKYVDRLDYIKVTPYIYTELGPALIYPNSYVVIDGTIGQKTVMMAAEFEALHMEGRLEKPRIITLS